MVKRSEELKRLVKKSKDSKQCAESCSCDETQVRGVTDTTSDKVMKVIEALKAGNMSEYTIRAMITSLVKDKKSPNKEIVKNARAMIDMYESGKYNGLFVYAGLSLPPVVAKMSSEDNTSAMVGDMSTSHAGIAIANLLNVELCKSSSDNIKYALMAIVEKCINVIANEIEEDKPNFSSCTAMFDVIDMLMKHKAWADADDSLIKSVMAFVEEVGNNLSATIKRHSRTKNSKK